jgi:RNA polymerase sigma-70 factor (ECF subfamily)
MDDQQLIPHLFRTEYRKIVSVLCKYFGWEGIETAEDIASETFLTAAQTWGIGGGIPANPSAWLYSVAKNKAKNHLQRSHLYRTKIEPTLAGSEETFEYPIDLSPKNIIDSQLQMMFAICHPSISTEAQIGLALRILCGFGIEEIANAFLSTKDTINKRLFRAKEILRQEKISMDIPPAVMIEHRLSPILSTIYLLFNEGYYSISQDKTLRKELCMEAMRLCTMLVENETTDKPQVNALLSLMCFHASRFGARLDKDGAIVLYGEQDTSLWNADLIGKGGYFLRRAAAGNKLSRYHLEAGIAWWNTQHTDSREKWDNILMYYNQLLQIEYSPIAALNRTYALSKANSKEEAIIEAEKLELRDNHFYFALLGELYKDIHRQKAIENFQEALRLAKTQTDKQSIQKQLDRL